MDCVRAPGISIEIGLATKPRKSASSLSEATVILRADKLLTPAEMESATKAIVARYLE